MEAMAMALPVIATNWSGPTEYMTETNSYPLRTDGLVEIDEGAFACAPAQAPPMSRTVPLPLCAMKTCQASAVVVLQTKIH